MKDIKNKTIKIIKLITSLIIKYKNIIYMSIPFILMDLITRLSTIHINFYPTLGISPNLFTISYISLFIGITLSLKKRIGKIFYLIFNIFFLIIFLVNNIYFGLTGIFFDFNLLESFTEGTPYILDTLLGTNPIIYLFTILIIYLIYQGYKKIPYKTKSNHKYLFITIISFLIIHLIIPTTLGKANEQLTWSSWKNPRNIYLSFNDSNKSFKVTGLYEYTWRNFYVTFLKTKEKENYEDELFLDQSYSESPSHKNKYTGIFKGKNLIIIQLEGIDSWLLNEKDMPTLYNMLNNSFNFTKHYSYYNGGGSTFNSEFAVNTGFITPLSYTQNAYTFNKNKFPYSLANLFKNENYSINAFHMNTGEYYSRTANYKNWGYDNYYGLIDITEYPDETYRLDRELILNQEFSNLMFNKNIEENDNQINNFVNYIITYSPHTPFSQNKGVCKLILDLENNNIENQETILSEEDCVRIQAKETDYMIELLLNKLEEENLIDNTVIAVFSDHYLYTLEDKTILNKYKETSNNLINQTPFFIWSKGLKRTNINQVTSQLNILPTLLNLFGITYNENNYIAKDALDNNYEGIVFFSDYSWYDGSVYVENGEITNNKNISLNKLEEKNYYINYITKKNDLTLKFNYFKKIKTN